MVLLLEALEYGRKRAYSRRLLAEQLTERSLPATRAACSSMKQAVSQGEILCRSRKILFLPVPDDRSCNGRGTSSSTISWNSGWQPLAQRAEQAITVPADSYCSIRTISNNQSSHHQPSQTRQPIRTGKLASACDFLFRCTLAREAPVTKNLESTAAVLGLAPATAPWIAIVRNR